MQRKSHSTGSIVGTVVLLVVVLLGLYVGGYFALGKYGNYLVHIVTRGYAYDWPVSVYRPLVHLESFVNGKEVRLDGPTKSYTSNGIAGHKDINGEWVED